MKRSLLAVLMLVAWAGIAGAQAGYGVPSPGIGTCASGKVVSALNQNAPPTCVSAGSAAGPINTLPPQTGNYSANNHKITGLSAPTTTGDALSQGNAASVTSLTASGATNITGATSGGNPITNADLNGAVNPLGHGVVCDGSTDNNPSSSGPLQLAINAAGAQAGPSTGYFTIPASCNPSSGHPLVFSTGITIPDNVKMVGLAGACWDGDTHCVQMNYTGSGVAVTATATHGTVFENIRVKNTGTGTIGILLDSTFRARVLGSSFEGFSSYGIDLTESVATSESNHIEQSSAFNNGGALILDGTQNASKAVGNNFFANDNLWGSTGSYNVVMSSDNSAAGTTGYQNVYRNVFIDDDVSQAGKSATVGIQSNATLDTDVVGLTAESLNTVYQLNAGTQNFSATGEGAILSTSATSVFTATGDSTYKICIGYIAGVGGNKCWQTIPEIDQYEEPTAFEDPTGQIGAGPLTNLLTRSEDFTNGAWTASGITGTTNTATSPAGVANGASAAVLTAGGASFFQQAYTLGSSIASTCWTGSVWMQTASGTARPQLVLYDSAGTQLAQGGIASAELTTSWGRYYVTGCASGGDSNTGIRFRPMYFSANAPSATINIWGAQLTETNGPQPYIKTVSSAITTTAIGSINPSFATGLTPGISGGGALATGSNSFSGTITGSAATGNVLTPGRVCPNATICILSDETTLGGSKVTSTNTTSCTYSSTASDTVDYQASCR